MKSLKNIAVLASGKGTNLQAISDNIRKGALRANLVVVISDRKDAFALKRARRAGVKALFIDPGSFGSRQAYDRELVAALKKERVDLVILAGFMRILSPFFVKSFHNRILNIHPALLPSFKGMDAIKDAYRYGSKVTGVTVHFVDQKMDHGLIIAQEAVAISDTETLAALEARIHKIEHSIYTEAIRKVLAGKIWVQGRRVICR